MRIVAIIPARYASTRFPGKPLIDIAGKTMIQRVYERATMCFQASDVCVATDDERIHSHILAFGGQCVMTSDTAVSGTDRCLEAYQKLNLNADAIINIQGDEPFVEPTQIEQLKQLIMQPAVEIASLAKRITDEVTLTDPSKVKVVMDHSGRALYFSRQTIPYVKSAPVSAWPALAPYYKHVGLYAYKPPILHAICALAPSALEKAESLEQLRWLEGGFSIHLGITDKESPAVDTPEDLAAIEQLLREGKLNLTSLA